MNVFTQYKSAILLFVVLGLAAAVCAVGYKMGKAVEIAHCAAEKDRLQQKVDTLSMRVNALEGDKYALKAALSEANQAVGLMKAQSDAAKQAQLEAEKMLADVKVSSENRIKKLTAAKQAATGCSDMLESYWEMRN